MSNYPIYTAKRFVALCLLLALALFVVACQPTTVAPTPTTPVIEGSGAEADESQMRVHPLVGKKWQLTAVEQGGTPLTLLPNPLTLSFEQDGRYGLTGGCNGLGGNWVLGENNALTMSLGASTLMACEDALMTQDQLLATLLSEVTSYQVEGSELILVVNEQTKLRFSATPATTDVEIGALIANNWNIVAQLIGGDAIASFSTPGTLTFHTDGTFNGNTGCNNFGGSYQLAEGKLTMQVGPVTVMACEESLMQQETGILEALAQVVGAQKGEAGMQLLLANGDVLYLELAQ